MADTPDNLLLQALAEQEAELKQLDTDLADANAIIALLRRRGNLITMISWMRLNLGLPLKAYPDVPGFEGFGEGGKGNRNPRK
jgi:hypothetical protein